MNEESSPSTTSFEKETLSSKKIRPESASKEPLPSRHRALKCAEVLHEKKAFQIKVLELSNVSSFTDYFVVASGTSEKHLQTLADSLSQEFKKRGQLSREGYPEGRWIVLDYGDFVVHLFLEAIRNYYQLESLWKTAEEVKLPKKLFAPGASQLIPSCPTS